METLRVSVDALFFPIPFDDQVINQLQLFNATTAPVTFRLAVTDKLFVVSPKGGTILPGQEANVRVLLPAPSKPHTQIHPTALDPPTEAEIRALVQPSGRASLASTHACNVNPVCMVNWSKANEPDTVHKLPVFCFFVVPSNELQYNYLKDGMKFSNVDPNWFMEPPKISEVARIDQNKLQPPVANSKQHRAQEELKYTKLDITEHLKQLREQSQQLEAKKHHALSNLQQVHMQRESLETHLAAAQDAADNSQHHLQQVQERIEAQEQDLYKTLLSRREQMEEAVQEHRRLQQEVDIARSHLARLKQENIEYADAKKRRREQMVHRIHEINRSHAHKQQQQHMQQRDCECAIM
eukprot:NODE_527_length_1394_cov_103.378058_g492_i0.p1 GENE.NODE_527_length_1394_cov_103.378058_g492_i0~~NODE_527_length_1394_cov_103.378058_g492_i0.p1  ORF type:complete len:353 (-),score=43.16 NODE_527_length_1394_cov_103.378058_g492_i0:85-1143(-)